MTVVKCDVCGNETNHMDVVRLKLYQHKPLFVYNFDLCPKCNKSLKSWIKERKEAE